MNATARDQHEQDTMLHAGQVLDRKYRVDYLVGQGGMAAVWAGTNERTGKRVALKVLLRSSLTKPGMESLLQREVLAASRIDHPNVVTVFDVIEHHHMPCIVMELLAGETLDRHLARIGKLSMTEAHLLLLPAMRGVAAAHAQGVIHADLKPQNIFVCVGPDGRPITTKVLDFGISQLAERARDPSARQATVMGTPAYMAPEQLVGSSPIDRRADVYGFGVIFYEAFSGQLPFPGKPGADLFQRIVTQPAPPLGEIRPDLPHSLVRVIDTALSKDPTLRHPCLDAMIGALEDQFLPETPAPRPVTWPSGVFTATLPELASRARGPNGHGSESDAEKQASRSTKVLLKFPRSKLLARAKREANGSSLEPSALEGGIFALEPQPQGIPRRALAAIRNSAHPRAWQSLLGVGAAALLAGIVLSIWLAAGTGSKQPAKLLPLVVAPKSPTEGQPAKEPSVPPTLDWESVPVAAVDNPTLPTSAEPVVEPAATNEATKAAFRGTPGHRRAAPATMSAKLSNQRPSSRQKPPTSSEAPRAGSLSADDF